MPSNQASPRSKSRSVRDRRDRTVRSITPTSSASASAKPRGSNRPPKRAPGKRSRQAQGDRVEPRALSAAVVTQESRANRANRGTRGSSRAASTGGKLRLPLAGGAAQLGASKSFDCSACGLCCTYVAIEIDGPTTAKRATEILWYLYHDGVSIYVNDDAWMVQFETTCRFLTADRRCGIYATRPHICREFSEQECEVNTGDDGHTFYVPATFMAHLKETRPRVYAHVMKAYAPPPEPELPEPAFKRRLNDVYLRRAAALERAGAPTRKTRRDGAFSAS